MESEEKRWSELHTHAFHNSLRYHSIVHKSPFLEEFEIKSTTKKKFGTLGSDEMDAFFRGDRNYLIMTTAGKPVYAL